ncbi:rho-related BTB domain-containing protein 3 isoform X1 [Pelobates fuscus]|uniref:rho-related BTB domain-containing protein 3 isoform X1 n=1 Tax=Pelobates fuscus TaxID=191477 RepID=UPI002FE43A4D
MFPLSIERSSPRSVRIVWLGDDRDRPCEDHAREDLVPFYLGRRAAGLQTENRHPVFTIYQARVLGDIQIVCHECLGWNIFNGDQCSQYVVGEADIIILKYSVSEKISFLDIKDNFAPLVKRKSLHRFIPVIVAAVGAAHNNGPSCTCPQCTSDRGICVTTSEGIQLAKDLAATFLELHAVNDFYVGMYFGGMLEYFIRQAFKDKSAVKGERKNRNKCCLPVKPPELEQPEKLPVLKDEPSQYESDFQGLLVRCQCVDVIFCGSDMDEVSAAHRIVLCSISPVFRFLFNKKDTGDFGDPDLPVAIYDLFSLCTEDDNTAPSSPVRVIVKDHLFSSCLSDILHFIYSGACQWGLLEQCLRKTMKDPAGVVHVLQRVRWIVREENPSDLSAGSPTLSHSLGHFFNTPVLADIIFYVQGFTVPAHRAVLIARCEVMAAMFSGNYMEAKSFQIPVYGVSKDTFLIFLEYLYTDSCCPASILQAISLLVCSEMYQVPRLQHMCESYIITQLQNMSSRELSTTSFSVVPLLRKAQFHHSECLSTWLLYFIATNYLIFSQKKEFQDLTPEERAFIEAHRWPSSVYLKKLAEYRLHVHSQKHRCAMM